MLRVAIICEGSSDYPVLRRVAEAVLAPEALTFREIQPDFDALQRKVPGALGPGWQGVRAFLGLPNLRVAAETSDIRRGRWRQSYRRARSTRPRTCSSRSAIT